MSEGGEARRDYNGERGLVPTRAFSNVSQTHWFDWWRLRQMREYLDALKKEMERLNAR